jgi:CRISPR/Cas system type I-B associated protein Csh2 (Cas7 group RAMP superfamily)
MYPSSANVQEKNISRINGLRHSLKKKEEEERKKHSCDRWEEIKAFGMVTHFLEKNQEKYPVNSEVQVDATFSSS